MLAAHRPSAVSPSERTPVWAPLLLLAVAAWGLFYVKWHPYWGKALAAAHDHAIGASILTGKAAAAPAASWQAAVGYALAYGRSIWQAMVLGLVLGSGVQALLPPGAVARWLGGGGARAVAAGGALSLPGMMCTCCAAPVAAGLRRARASVGAAMAFWLGNPVLNPATLVFIGFVLGWRWAALRLVLGLPMVLGLSALAARLSPPDSAEPARAALAEAGAVAERPGGGPLRRWAATLVSMTVRLVPEYVILVLLLGAARAWLFPVIGPAAGNTLPWILAFAAAGALFVIPTAGEAPIVQAMLALGVGAGPAGALLLTLPPVSLPSLAMVSGVFPARALAAVTGGVVLFGVLAGLLAAGLHL